ncbi:MAG: hypothetical protein ACR2HV_05605 [Acidimicrobiales bacterium]
MVILVIIVAAVAVATAGVYVAGTRPCENGFHQRRHWRFRRFRPGGCSAVD